MSRIDHPDGGREGDVIPGPTDDTYEAGEQREPGTGAGGGTGQTDADEITVAPDSQPEDGPERES